MSLVTAIEELKRHHGDQNEVLAQMLPLLRTIDAQQQSLIRQLNDLSQRLGEPAQK